MLQDMDDMEASCVLYVMFGTFDQHEQRKISVLTVPKMGIVRHTVQHDLIVSVSFIWYPRDFARQTSPDILSLEGLPV